MTKKQETVIGLGDTDVGELIEELQERGYYIARTPLARRGQTFKGDLKRWSGNKYRFGVVSDTHLCSRYQQLHHLSAFYSMCARKRIDAIFHCGDFVDGEHVYRGHEYELFVHGADAQRDYAVDNYPSRKRVTTYVVSGNHDQSFWKNGGYNIVQAIARHRSDIVWLGDDYATYVVGEIRLGLMHSTGGVAYATSYKTQKIVEKFPGGEKPHMLFVGHFHTPNVIPMYRNVETVQMSSFQAQTPYMAARGLQATVAGLIVTIQTDDAGLARVVYEWIPFYQTRKDDF